MPMNFFVSDLHGKADRFEKLFKRILEEKPSAVFLGGDLLPSGLKSITYKSLDINYFIKNYLIKSFLELRKKMGDNYPVVFIILGNDDCRSEEKAFIEAGKTGVWEYIHNKKTRYGAYTIYGYSCIPPTPFLLKDWELYDVARYVDPGCIPPEEGYHSIPRKKDDILYYSIQKELELLVEKDDLLSKSIFLFHSPPYKTKLDRASLDGRMYNYVPLDVHVGSIAIKRFIETRQPLVTLHGHVHESARLTGTWKEKIGDTLAFTAAHDGPELALIRFDPEKLQDAERSLI